MTRSSWSIARRARELTPWGRVALTLAGVAALTLLPTRAQAAPFTPKSDDQVLERVRYNVNDTEARELRTLRAQLAKEPKNLKLAYELAKRYLQRGRYESDPRYTGYAQAVLAPWYGLANPPEPVLVLRATIKQRVHDFQGALVDVEAALKLNPNDPQAWVTRSVIKLVTADPEAAKQSCQSLFQSSTELVAVTCLAGVSALNGQAAKAASTVERVLELNLQANTAEKLWAYSILADAALRSNQKTLAENAFRKGLGVVATDTFMLSAYADYLIAEGRAKEAIKLLEKNTRPDPLLLRLILAEQAAKDPRLANHVAEMKARIAASTRRGDTVHRREEALFTLRVLGKPKEALELAKQNFEIQKEPLDAQILLESAIASKQPEATKPVLEWLKVMKLEDAAIAKLVKQLQGVK